MNEESMHRRLQMLTMWQVAAELEISIPELQSLFELRQLRCFRLGLFGERIRVIRCDLNGYVARRDSSRSRSSLSAPVSR